MQLVKSMKVCAVIFFISQAATLSCPSCGIRRNYNQTSVTVTCEGVDGVIPQCLPEETESLTIANSPEFSRVGKFHLDRYTMLEGLFIINTGLKQIHVNAFQRLDNLKTIEIKNAAEFRRFSRGIFSGRNKLQTITVENCPKFRTLQNGIFRNLTNLQILKLQHNAIQEIDEDILDLSVNVRHIDLSSNKPLEYLPRYVFANLGKLYYLLLTNRSLQVLYPDHVRTSYESGSLRKFDGRHNLWQCDRLEQFVVWLQRNKRFSGIAKMGKCSGPRLSQHQHVLYLLPYQFESSRNARWFLLDDANLMTTTTTPTIRTKSESNSVDSSKNSRTRITVIVIVIVVLSLIVFLLAAKVCSCGCRSSSGTSQNRPSTRGVAHARNYTNQGYDEQDLVRATQLSREMFHQSDCNVGDWNINCVDPPSYEDVVDNNVGLSRTQELGKISDTQAEYDNPAPPPYDGSKNL